MKSVHSVWIIALLVATAGCTVNDQEGAAIEPDGAPPLPGQSKNHSTGPEAINRLPEQSIQELVLHDCIGFGLRLDTHPSLLFPYPAPEPWPNGLTYGESYFGFGLKCERAVLDGRHTIFDASIAWESHSNLTPPPELSENAWYGGALWMPQIYASPPALTESLRKLAMPAVNATFDLSFHSDDAIQNSSSLDITWATGSVTVEATTSKVHPYHQFPWPYRFYYSTDPPLWFSFHSDFYQDGESLVASLSGTGDAMAAIYPTPTDAMAGSWNFFYGATIGIIPQGDGSW